MQCRFYALAVFAFAFAAVGLADEISDQIKERKAAAASAAEKAKEDRAVVVPEDVVKTLDYREWQVWHYGEKGSPESATVSGRVVKFYLPPVRLGSYGSAPGAAAQAKAKAAAIAKAKAKIRHPASFVVETKEGKKIEIYTGVGLGDGSANAERVGKRECYQLALSSPAVKKDVDEKITDGQRYLGTLFRKVYRR